MDELGAEAMAAGVTLHGPAGHARTLGDPVLLRQAVSNLVRNAVRHNHAGGEVAVRLIATSITVVNTGPPVPPESVATLTEPFTRGAGRALTRGAGHGLGLAIVAAVATAHDATLTLRPNPGRPHRRSRPAGAYRLGTCSFSTFTVSTTRFSPPPL